jgi:hypothetical protein
MSLKFDGLCRFILDVLCWVCLDKGKCLLLSIIIGQHLVLRNYILFELRGNKRQTLLQRHKRRLLKHLEVLSLRFLEIRTSTNEYVLDGVLVLSLIRYERLLSYRRLLLRLSEAMQLTLNVRRLLQITGNQFAVLGEVEEVCSHPSQVNVNYLRRLVLLKVCLELLEKVIRKAKQPTHFLLSTAGILKNSILVLLYVLHKISCQAHCCHFWIKCVLWILENVCVEDQQLLNNLVQKSFEDFWSLNFQFRRHFLLINEFC